MAMDRKALLSNAGVAFVAQGVSMGLAMLQSLIVPKMLSGEPYGYWQLFLFYISYIGFFHLGINDGVYLIHGGKTREEIDKRSVASQFVFAVAFQTLFALIVVAIALLGGFGPERQFVLVCAAIFMVPQNAASYLAFVFQAMNETKRASYSTIIERTAFLVPLVCLLFFGVTQFEPYIFAYVFSMCVQLGFCLYHARDFFGSGLLSPAAMWRESSASIKVGIKLMLANIASQLILGLARGSIDNAWGIESFGKLSLLLSVVNFFLAFVSQASMVLFPALRQSSEAEMRGFFGAARDVMGLVMPVVYLFYVPMVWLLTLWLPAYADSFGLLALLLPICIFESKMDVCCTTFFKVRREETLLLIINVGTALVSWLGTMLGIYVFNSIYVVISAVVVAIAGRSLISELYIAKSFGLEGDLIPAGEIVVTLVFVLSAQLLNGPLGMAVYGVAYAAYLYCFRKRLAELRHVARV